MSNHSADNKRIAKNTLMLYIRMLLMMGVTLYTSRVVLSALGVEDFGIYNVVGGVVSMFSTMNVTLSNSISRFITFELGKGDQQRLNRLFSTSIVMQIVMSLVLILLIETVGMWLLVNKLVIPPDRLFAAKWVLHLSSLSLFIGMISVPFNATIIAHERMSAFAYISILEAVGKLGIAFVVMVSPIDRLIMYSIMMVAVSVILRITYGVYSSRHFEECRGVRLVFDKDILKEMFGFAGWSSLSIISYSLKEYGGNIVLNLFFGPAVNAAKGIANQVHSAVTKFSKSFTTALNPQIIKSYVSGDRDRMFTLVFQGSRLIFYMLLFLSLPIFLNTDYILVLWLGSVPEYTSSFIQLTLTNVMLTSWRDPFEIAIRATGDIKNFQISYFCVSVLNLPISYLLLKLGFSPDSVLWVGIVASVLNFSVLLYMLRVKINVPVRKFLREVVANIMLVLVVALVVPLALSMQLSESFWSFLLICSASVISTVGSIYFVGCSRAEREFVVRKITKIMSSAKNKLLSTN